MYDRVSSAKDLDNTNLFLRKGLLQIIPRKLQVCVALPLKLDRNTTFIPSMLDWDNSYVYNSHLKFHRFYRTKPVKTDWTNFSILVRKYLGGLDESITLFDWKTHRKWDNDKVTESGKWQEHYGVNMKKLITQDELAELETEKTPKEWCQFARRIRKRVTSLVFRGELKGVLNRCDKLKIHKDHAKVTANINAKMQELEAAITSFQGMAHDLSVLLLPMVKVQPYDNWRFSLNRVEDSVQSIIGEIGDFREKK